MKVYIKNMVCNRCKNAVQTIFKSEAVDVLSVELGEVEIAGDLDKAKRCTIDKKLHEQGFEVIDDRKSRLAEKVKNLIISLVHQQHNELKTNLSAYITQVISQDYSHISSVFSQVEGITIEQYYILQKVERIKELLVYDELNVNEIADKMH